MRFNDYPEDAKAQIMAQRDTIRNKRAEILKLSTLIRDLKSDVKALLDANKSLSTDIYTYRGETVRMRRYMTVQEEECEKRIKELSSIQDENAALKRENNNLKLWMEIKGVRKNPKGSKDE